MQSYTIAMFEFVKVAIGAAALASIWIAHRAYQANVQKQQEDRVRDADKELLSQAKTSLEWAYNALTQHGDNIPPKSDRLNWLTCARHILRQNEIAERLQGSTYKIVYAEVRDYWQHKFYLALSDIGLLNPAYFRNKENSAWPENIEISSALVIVDFSNWKEGLRDPTDNVDRAAMMADGNCFKGSAGRGLRSYIRELEEIRGARNPDRHIPPHQD